MLFIPAQRTHHSHHTTRVGKFTLHLSTAQHAQCNSTAAHACACGCAHSVSFLFLRSSRFRSERVVSSVLIVVSTSRRLHTLSLNIYMSVCYMRRQHRCFCFLLLASRSCRYMRLPRRCGWQQWFPAAAATAVLRWAC
jgi:hypothetical protein